MKRIRIRKISTIIAVSFLAGLLWSVGVRFIAYQPPEQTHYHANFALFIDGERYPFDRFSFYEEVAACGADAENNPKVRVHMHDNESHIVHVHAKGVTWGHFFANLGMANGDSVFRTDTDTYSEASADSITFILNGEEVTTTANRIIGSEDKLLVSVAREDVSVDVDQEYSQIESDAGIYNGKDDPASCAGSMADPGVIDRLRHAVLGT